MILLYGRQHQQGFDCSLLGHLPVQVGEIAFLIDDEVRSMYRGTESAHETPLDGGIEGLYEYW